MCFDMDDYGIVFVLDISVILMGCQVSRDDMP